MAGPIGLQAGPGPGIMSLRVVAPCWGPESFVGSGSDASGGS